MTSPVTARAYDSLTVRLHWIVAAAVLVQWGGAHLIDAFPRGSPRVNARSVHIVLGACLLVLVVLRIWWRARRGVRFAPDPDRRLALAARLGHLTLYLLLLSTLALGVTDAVVRRDSLFGLTHLPSFDLSRTGRHALDEQVVSFHRTSANLLLWVAAAHASVALVHHLILRDGVLARMIPGLPRSAARVNTRGGGVGRRDLGT